MSTSPAGPSNPKPKFSFHNLRARFRTHSEHSVAQSADWGSVHQTKSPSETSEWTGEDLYYSKSVGASPLSSSLHLIPRTDKELPPPPPQHSIPVRRATADAILVTGGVAAVSSNDYLSAQVAQYRQPQKLSPSIEMLMLHDSHSDVPKSDGVVTTIKSMAKGALALASNDDVKDLFSKLKTSFTGLNIEVPSLIHLLDDVAKIHPSIAIAVIAFKIAHNMVKTRRDNDKRIMFLHASMADMMSLFCELRDVKDGNILDDQGVPLGSRLERISIMIAKDIKDCQLACDVYSKKKTILKVLQSQTYESKLSGFVALFEDRRRELQFALAINTANAVHAMSNTLDHASRQLTELTSMVLQLFQKEFRTEEEVLLARKVEDLGGAKAVENNDVALAELAGLGSTSTAKEVGSGLTTLLQAGNVKNVTFTLQDLKDELHESWETTLAKHMKTFEGKFELSQRQLREDFDRTLRHEADRVIDEMHRGPHDKIKNKELREIWKDMDWKLNVKARLFVMTLRDQYRERAHSTTSPRFDATSDDWAFEYINTKYLQPIMEAFDDDGSGYVTYQEVNEFADAMPESLHWSFPHWMAYWAVGWQATSSRYCQKILNLLDHMFVRLGEVHPENRYWADYYLQHVWPVTFELVKAFRPATVPEHVEAKFQAYVDFEEERIRRNLADIRFDIDALDTVYVVAGPGRIEKYLFPLVYLLLERDLEVFNVASKVVLHREELLDAADSLMWVFQAMHYRYLDLSALYKQNNLNVDSQMKVTACGLYDYLHDPTALWTWRNLAAATGAVQPTPTGSSLRGEVPRLEILNYPTENEARFKCDLYDEPPEQASQVDLYARMPVRVLLGQWNGFIYNENQYPSQLMLSFHIHALSTVDTQDFTATGIHDTVPFDVSGRCWLDSDNIAHVQFSVKYRGQFGTQYFMGYLDDDNTLVGSVGSEENPDTHGQQFILKHDVPDRYLRFRPSPAELAEDKPRALWNFATQAVLHDIRRRNWSWKNIEERRNVRTAYIELSTRLTVYKHTATPIEWEEWLRCMQAMNPVDASFYKLLRNARLKTVPRHDCVCLGCKGMVGGARVVCMDCLSSQAEARTIDFCDNLDCFRQDIRLDIRDSTRQHISTHDLFKVRTILHPRDVPSLLERAQGALNMARECFQSPGDDENPYEADSGVALSDDGDESARCSVCCGRLSMSTGCWFCVDCFDFEQQMFICDRCEKDTQLRCVRCTGRFKQSTWYYGGQQADTFECNTCQCNTGRKPLPDANKHRNHVYTHTLVRCTSKSNGQAQHVERSTEERLSALEETVWALNGKIERVEATLSRIERLLLANLPQGRRPSVSSMRIVTDGSPVPSPLRTASFRIPDRSSRIQTPLRTRPVVVPFNDADNS